jgi:hypothetical protein
MKIPIVLEELEWFAVLGTLLNEIERFRQNTGSEATGLQAIHDNLSQQVQALKERMYGK